MKRWITLAAVAGTALVAAIPAFADNGTDSTALRSAVTVPQIQGHLTQFSAIAAANGGNRVAAGPGHVASGAYVESQLPASYFTVTRQNFTFDYFEELTPSTLTRLTPGPVSYTYLTDFFTMDYSGSATISAAATAVDVPAVLPGPGGSTSGCEAADFAGFPAGNIAIIQRGTCAFADKARNAEAAGASAVIIFNEGNAPDRIDLFGGTLGSPIAPDLPVLSASYGLGAELVGLIRQGPVQLQVGTNTFNEPRSTFNVIAETKQGRADRAVVVGAHLDSVGEGPGINDNGTGSGGILEIARQMAATAVVPRNKVRFIWFGAEEAGLIGSERYVASLSTRQIKDISVMLNFDMIGSPNFGRFVYDGDGSASEAAGPNGSDVIENVFTAYFASQGLSSAPTAFDGRSDYGPFIDAGVPAGGLFTGAEDIKTAEEAALFGGTAGVAFDPCYHQACDTLANVNPTGLDQMADAATHAVLTFAMSTSSVNGTAKGNGSGQADLDYKGANLRK